MGDGYPDSLTNEYGDLTERAACAIADALRPDDKVVLGDRSRPIRVLGREEKPTPGIVSSPFYPVKIVWLRGNGTEYRLFYSHTGEHYPTLNTDSELDTRDSYSVRHEEVQPKTIATEAGERVIEIHLEGINDATLDSWALRRNLEPQDGFEGMEVQP